MGSSLLHIRRVLFLPEKYQLRKSTILVDLICLGFVPELFPLLVVVDYSRCYRLGDILVHCLWKPEFDRSVLECMPKVKASALGRSRQVKWWLYRLIRS